jgi:hypothetical protein
MCKSNKMKYHPVLVLLLYFSMTTQGQHWMKVTEPRLDTLCYPFQGGLQLIIINHEGYAAMQNKNLAIKHGPQSSLPPYVLSKDNEYFFRDSSGRIVKTFNRLKPSLDTLTSVFRDLQVNSFRDSSNNKSLEQHLNQELVENQFLNKDYFLVAKVPRIESSGLHYYHNYQLETLEDNVGLINRSGDLTVPYSYKKLEPIGDYFLAYQKDKVGIINAQNEIIVPIIFDSYKMETDNLYTFWKEKKCFGVFQLNTSNFILIKGYEALNYLRGLEEYGFAQVRKNGKYGLVNKRFETIIPIIYDEMKNYSHLGYCRVKKEGSYGFLDTTGNVIVPIQYPKIGDIFLEDRIWFANKEGKYGFLDRNGKEIISAQYDYTTNFYVDKTMVFKDGLAAFINTKGELLTAYQYKQVQYRREQFVVTNIAGYTGVLNSQLKEIVPCLYKRIHGAIGSEKSYWLAVLKNETHHEYTKEGKRIN